jgi:uncharacterized protein (UPF0305 family)
MRRAMMGSGPLGPEQRLAIRADGLVVGTAIVRLPQTGLLPQDVAFRSAVNRMLLVGGIIAGLVALGLGLMLARRATAPARELTRAARAVAAGDRSERVAYEAPDELGEMATAFNSMADTIEEEDRLRFLKFLLEGFCMLVQGLPGHPIGMPFPGGDRVSVIDGTYYCPVREKANDVDAALCPFCPAEQTPEIGYLKPPVRGSKYRKQEFIEQTYRHHHFNG